MNFEKRNLKMFNVIIAIVLAAVLLTAFGGFIIQRETTPLKDASLGMGSDVRLMMEPEFAQTGPTGSLVMSAGIVLLIIGFVVLVTVMMVVNSMFYRKFT